MLYKPICWRDDGLYKELVMPEEPKASSKSSTSIITLRVEWLWVAALLLLANIATLAVCRPWQLATSGDRIVQVTGQGLTDVDFIAYLKAKYASLYAIDL